MSNTHVEAMTKERHVRLGRLVGELHEAALSARACGLTFDEVTFLLKVQFDNAQEMAACACGARWTKGDLLENPNAADEHECRPVSAST